MPFPQPAGRGLGESGLRCAVAVSAVLIILLGHATLKAAGISLPGLGNLPQPLGGPWLVVVAFLVLLHVRARARSVPTPARFALRPGDLLTLAVAVLGVGTALEWARPWMLGWTRPPAVPDSFSAPLFRLGMGGVLLVSVAALLTLVPRFRRRLRELGSARRLRSGLFFTVAVVAVVYAILVSVGHAVAGPGNIRFHVPLYVPASLAALFGQVAIAMGEESFYRGLLQGEMTRLLGRAGIRRPRDRKLAALVAVSMLFALHHVRPGMPTGVFASVLIYSFAMSLLFGFLFDLTRNLAVCSFAHLFNNLTVLGLGPSLAAPEAVEAFGDGVYVAAYLLVAFSLLFLLSRNSSESLHAIRPR